MHSTATKPSLKIQISELLLWLVPGVLALSLLMLAHYQLSIEKDKQYALNNELVIVGLVDEVLGETLATMSADAKNLAYVSQKIVSQNSQSVVELTAYFEQLSSNNLNYDQIRFINPNGMEKLRVNNFHGEVAVVPLNKLQDKSQRYYWQQTIGLEAGKVYISPMDLNVEDGKVQYPLNPTIRVGTPVYDDKNRLLGVIVLNYKGDQLIHKLFNIAPNFINHLYLLNPQGFAVIHPSDDPRTRFNFDTKSSLDASVLDKIRSLEQGQFSDDGHYYSFASVDAPNNGVWTVVSDFPQQRFDLAHVAFFERYAWVYGLLLVGLIFCATVFSRYRVQTRFLSQQRHNELQFRQTMENIQLAAVTMDRRGIITFCNDYFLNMVGYRRDEVEGSNWIQRFIPQELHPQASEALHEAIRLQTHQAQSESVVMSKSGEIHLVAWTSTFSESFHQQLSLTLLGEDRTEQKLAQDQLQQLSHAVESSQNSVMITNLKGLIVYVNPFFCELTGYSRDEVLGRSPKFLQSGDMDVNDYTNLWATLTQGMEWRGEFHNRKKNGVLYWERVRISAVNDVEGRALYYVAVKQDITEEKRLLAQVERQQRDRIQHEKLAEVGKVVNMIAHDLRNPLSSIKMVLQINARKSEDEMFTISLDQVRYMEAILEELLAYSKPDEFKPEWIDINKLIQTIIAGQQKLSREWGIALDVQLQPNLPTLYADPIKIRQALQNVLLNALQAAKLSKIATAKVMVSTNIMITDSNTQLLIDIENNGQSIDPCLADKVFEPFFTTKAQGTGLGLAIVKRIIDTHSGNISLQAMESSGTRVRIRIPTTQTELWEQEKQGLAVV
ncbi:PAS domain S-box protein [Alginatibacterium sediminis]|uniref:histidine kinase n=2 Tax=Alginatibacterium sediminis TaxID=2164068 RepID=A0A420ELF0_9ALTE|nr:PAS domain S-box protein [Alginatibacterium sediminis]